ncbi:MAG: hypothetical protein M2R45_00611 [Verrucomicrobia subdivision 3 bacterium]|nr:hypothetical protein [Limisphaerales bacterium]MCS1414505.1 hypothetical protein [Limisphaerales bacterium]
MIEGDGFQNVSFLLETALNQDCRALASDDPNAMAIRTCSSSKKNGKARGKSLGSTRANQCLAEQKSLDRRSPSSQHTGFLTYRGKSDGENAERGGDTNPCHRRFLLYPPRCLTLALGNRQLFSKLPSSGLTIGPRRSMR